MKIKQTLLVIALLIGVGGFFVAPVASALKCGGVDTSVIECSEDSTGTDIRNTGVWGILKLAYTILTAGVGVAAIGGVVYASILYASAADSSEQTKKAVGIIVNVAIGLIAYALMFLLLNFIIPGGVLW